MDLSELFSRYGGTINAGLFIGLLTLWVTRLGQRDTRQLQTKANELVADKQRFDQIESLARQWRADAAADRRRRVEAEDANERLEDNIEELQHRYIKEVQLIAERLYKNFPECTDENDSQKEQT